MVGEQRRDRDTECREIIEWVPEFLAEIEMETARGWATYAEAEESEADLQHRRWAVAGLAVQRCREAQAMFDAATLAVETVCENSGVNQSNLRIVNKP